MGKYNVYGVTLFLVIFHAVGILGFSMDRFHSLFRSLVPLNLLLSLALLMLFHQPFRLKHVLLFFLIFLTGFFVEMAGVNTGIIFGNYSYGESLGLKIGSTPLLIGVNWLMLIYAVHVMMKNITPVKSVQIIAGGFFMVGYDMLLEPVAMKTGMWSWEGREIPIQNYLAWYLISVILLTVMQFSGKFKNPLAIYLFMIQVIFFAILNLTL